MKQYLNNNEILLQFDTGLKKLLEKNPKENIDKLSFIAIKHNYLTKNFVQLIFKYNDMVYNKI